MPKKMDERTFQMRQNYVQLHDEGYTPQEIAKMHGLSLSTVYSNLSAIAKKAGRTRESLLERPINAIHSGRNFVPVKPVDTADLDRILQELVEKLENLTKEIKQKIAEMEEGQ